MYQKPLPEQDSISNSHESDESEDLDQLFKVSPRVWPSSCEFLKAVAAATTDAPEKRKQWLENWKNLPASDWPKEQQDLLTAVEGNYQQTSSNRINRRELFQLAGGSFAIFCIGHFMLTGELAKSFSRALSNSSILSMFKSISPAIAKIKNNQLQVQVQELWDKELDKYKGKVNPLPISLVADLMGMATKLISGRYAYHALNRETKFDNAQIQNLFSKVAAFEELGKLISKKYEIEYDQKLHFQVTRFYNYISQGVNLDVRSFTYDLLFGDYSNQDKIEVLRALGIKTSLILQPVIATISFYFLKKKLNFNSDRYLNPVAAILERIKPQLSQDNKFLNYQTIKPRFSEDEVKELKESINIIFRKKLNLEFKPESLDADRKTLCSEISAYYWSENCVFEAFIK